MTDESVTFDVDGLIADLDHLWITYARNYQKRPDEGIRNIMNFISTVEEMVKDHRHIKHWKQGTLFEAMERKRK